AVGVVDPLEVAGYLLAEEAVSERMIGIAAELDGPAVGDRDGHAAGVGAVVGADGPDGQGKAGHGDGPRGDFSGRSGRSATRPNRYALRDRRDRRGRNGGGSRNPPACS